MKRKKEGISLNEFVVIDIETTGIYFEYWDEPIEVCGIKVKDNNITDTFHCFIKPYKKIPQKISELTGITAETVKHSENKYKVLPKFREFIGDNVVVAQNASFDVKFLNFWFLQLNLPLINKFICTMKTYKNILKSQGIKEKKSAKLIDICNFFGVKLEKSHSALEDTKATAQVFIEEYKNYKDLLYIEDLTPVQSYIKIKKRIASSNMYNKISKALEPKFDVPDCVNTEDCIHRCYSLLDNFKSPEFIIKELKILPEKFEDYFVSWLNYLNISKQYSIISNNDAVKCIKEILKYAKGNVEEAIRIHTEIFGKKPDTLMYKTVWKLEYCPDSMQYRYEDFLYYFNNGKTFEEIAAKMKRDKIEIIPFFVKWIVSDNENRELYRDYLKNYLIKKSELKYLLSLPDIEKYIQSLDNENKFTSLLTYSLYKEGFFKKI